MSFYFPPIGLQASSRYARYVDIHDNEEWPRGGVVTCPPSPPFGSYVIFVPNSGSVFFTADPATMSFFNPPSGFQFTDLTQFPFYTLRVKLKGPNGLGYWFDPPTCFHGPYDYATGIPLSSLSLDGNFVTTTGGVATTEMEGSNHEAQNLTTEWLYLVNPDPPWPSPDLDGNTFGSVLWLAEDIPSVTGTVFAERGPSAGSGEGVLQIYVNPYFEVDPEEPVEGLPYSGIIGSS